jgi:hypothetical protein
MPSELRGYSIGFLIRSWMWEKLGNVGNSGFSMALWASRRERIANKWSNIGANRRSNVASLWSLQHDEKIDPEDLHAHACHAILAVSVVFVQVEEVQFCGAFR